jgi:hypothetical protein
MYSWYQCQVIDPYDDCINPHTGLAQSNGGEDCMFCLLHADEGRDCFGQIVGVINLGVPAIEYVVHNQLSHLMLTGPHTHQCFRCWDLYSDTCTVAEYGHSGHLQPSLCVTCKMETMIVGVY